MAGSAAINFVPVKMRSPVALPHSMDIVRLDTASPYATFVLESIAISHQY
jgi:hypothetical protein